MEKLIDMKVGYASVSPAIKGTRIRVMDIAQLCQLHLEELGKDELPDDLMVAHILEVFPHLSAEKIQAALDYWRAHKTEIESEIEEELEILRTLEEKYPNGYIPPEKS